MKYDRDLKSFRAFVVLLIALNASMTVLCAVRREWVAGFASIAWAVSASLTLRSIRVLQETRNHIAGTVEQRRAEWRAMMAEAAAKGKEALAALGAGAEAALAADEEQRKRADRVKHWLN